MTRPRPLQQLLGFGSSASLIERVDYLRSINANLQACLDTETAPHVQVANLTADRLLIHADSTAWATRLRYQSPQLLRCLHRNASLSALRRIDIRVTPLAQPAYPARQPATLSATNAAIIKSTADNIPDPSLRDALKRLARHGNSKSGD